MTSSKQTCPLCETQVEEEIVVIGEKGAEGINRASIERGDTILVISGTGVHKTCRMDYVNKKYIELSKKSNLKPSKQLKRSARVSTRPYDSKTHCLFCGNEVERSILSSNYDDFCCVKTDSFVQSILSHCKQRNDDWAFTVEGRIEYFARDLHAADCLYHRSCAIHFRTIRDIPIQHRTNHPIPRKQTKIGRPKDSDQDQAFIRMCSFFEEYDEEQLTISCLANKMKEYLKEQDSVAYGHQYLKSKLLKHYGESIFIAEGEGLNDIITFREKTNEILRDYFSMPKMNNEESQKRLIIETAARLIKSDIKSKNSANTDEYPKTSDLELESALEYVPMSLHYFLQQILVGKDTRRKVASIGHSIVQAVRPRVVIAPLQLGLAVQMHHHFRSRFLIDSLSAMGFCSSYSEV